MTAKLQPLGKPIQFPMRGRSKSAEKRLQESLKRGFKEWQRKLTLDFANARSWEWLQSRYGEQMFYDCDSETEFLGLQVPLRRILKLEPFAEVALPEWLSWSRPGTPLMLADRSLGFIVPNPCILRVNLAFAVVELAKRVRVCENPECPAPYFIGRRKQRFCDRPACLAYGQRAEKRAWWAKHREEQLAKRQKARATRKARERKKRGGRKNDLQAKRNLPL